MASIYGPSALQRRRRFMAVESASGKLSPMQMFWLVIALLVCIAVMVRLELDAGDPELDDTLRRLQLIQQRNESYRPLDPAIFELPLYQLPTIDPSILGPLQTAEVIESQPVPTPPTSKSPTKRTRHRAPRPAPAQ